MWERLPAEIKEIVKRLKANGHDTYIVGGAVRDDLLGKLPIDFDLASSATPEEMEAALVGMKIIPTGKKHGTLTVVSGLFFVEVTTFRADGDYLDGRRPATVSYAKTIEEDLSRRDFTVNAIAYSPETDYVDPYGGQYDLEKKVLRTVGNPHERFAEDGLRILRALRLIAELGLEVEQETEHALYDCLETVQNISPERIGSEFTRFILAEGFAQVFAEHFYVFCEVFVEFKTRKRYFPVGYEQASRFAELLPPTRDLRLSALILPMADEERESFLARLYLPKKENEKILSLAAEVLDEIEPDAYVLKKLLNRMGEQFVTDLLTLRSVRDRIFCGYGDKTVAVEKLYTEILEKGECFQLSSMQIDGRDLIDAGVQPGTEVGRILEELLDQVMRGELPNEKKALLTGAMLIL